MAINSSEKRRLIESYGQQVDVPTALFKCAAGLLVVLVLALLGVAIGESATSVAISDPQVETDR